MTVAVDKNSKHIINDKHDYIYLFDDEPLDELLSLKVHCMYFKKVKYVDLRWDSNFLKLDE